VADDQPGAHPAPPGNLPAHWMGFHIQVVGWLIQQAAGSGSLQQESCPGRCASAKPPEKSPTGRSARRGVKAVGWAAVCRCGLRVVGRCKDSSGCAALAELLNQLVRCFWIAGSLLTGHGVLPPGAGGSARRPASPRPANSSSRNRSRQIHVELLLQVAMRGSPLAHHLAAAWAPPTRRSKRSWVDFPGLPFTPPSRCGLAGFTFPGDIPGSTSPSWRIKGLIHVPDEAQGRGLLGDLCFHHPCPLFFVSRLGDQLPSTQTGSFGAGCPCGQTSGAMGCLGGSRRVGAASVCCFFRLGPRRDRASRPPASAGLRQPRSISQPLVLSSDFPSASPDGEP